MRVLSLFDGIATGRLALEMAGVPVDLYIASEIDKDAKAVARANWPDMIHIGPVESVTAWSNRPRPADISRPSMETASPSPSPGAPPDAVA